MDGATIRAVRRAIVIACTLALSLVACGGGGAGAPSDGPTSDPTTSETAAPPAGTVVNAIARGCHRTRAGEADIQFSFSIADRTAVDGYGGLLDFHLVSLTEPTAWTTVDGAPEVEDRPNNDIFHLVVPAGEPIPAQLVLHVEAETVEGAMRTFDLQPDAILGVPVGVCTTG
ncbi:MAG TPA: hypothetical protein VGR41_07050 [Actinomycetota bacterium]|nr:hypothetical protein [Actinomycetota bacterium]